MTATIRIDMDTKERLKRLKREGETWSEFLDRLATESEMMDDSAWAGTEKSERAHEAIERSRESFE